MIAFASFVYHVAFIFLAIVAIIGAFMLYFNVYLPWYNRRRDR